MKTHNPKIAVQIPPPQPPSENVGQTMKRISPELSFFIQFNIHQWAARSSRLRRTFLTRTLFYSRGAIRSTWPLGVSESADMKIMLNPN
jgi:hypothetical protein